MLSAQVVPARDYFRYCDFKETRNNNYSIGKCYQPGQSAGQVRCTNDWSLDSWLKIRLKLHLLYV